MNQETGKHLDLSFISKLFMLQAGNSFSITKRFWCLNFSYNKANLALLLTRLHLLLIVFLKHI